MKEYQSKLLSVAMPTFGHHDVIGKSINSVLSQTYTNLELIIVPVRGDTRTLRAIEPFLSDKRVRLELSDYALITHQMNLGAYHAKGKYFMYFASDDFLYPDSAKQMRQLAKKTNAIVVYPDIDIGNRTLGVKRTKIVPDFSPNISLSKSSYIVDVSLVHLPTFMKYLPMKFSVGKGRIREVWKQMASKKKFHKRIIRYPHPSFIYRVHPDSVHLHGSQRAFRIVRVGRNLETKKHYAPWKRIAATKLKPHHFTTVVLDPGEYINHRRQFAYKRVIVHWADNVIDFADKFCNWKYIYNVTTDRDVWSKLQALGLPNVRFFESTPLLQAYVQEEDYSRYKE